MTEVPYKTLERDADLRQNQWNYVGSEDDSAKEIREFSGSWIKPLGDGSYKIVETTNLDGYGQGWDGDYLIEEISVEPFQIEEMFEAGEIHRMISDEDSWPDNIVDVVYEVKSNHSGAQVPDNSHQVDNYWGFLSDRYGISPPNNDADNDSGDTGMPGTWEAGGGESSDNYYTRWFYNPDKGLEAEWYWDAEPQGDGEHKIIVRKDHEGAYPEMTRSFDTEEEADQNLNQVLKEASRKVD